MNKDGHIGVVMEARAPIKKVDQMSLNHNLSKNNKKVNDATIGKNNS